MFPLARLRLAVAYFGCVVAAFAQNVFVNGNLETGSVGSVPPSPWSINAPSGQGSALVASGSSIYGNVFSIGSRGVLLADAAADTSASPILTQGLPAQTAGPLTLSFDFRLEGPLANSPWVVDLRPANGAAMHIRFLVDYAGNHFQVQNGGQLLTVLQLQPNTWYQVRANIDLLTKTYSGTITPYGGQAAGWTNAAFGTNQADIGGIVISDGSPSVTGTPLRLDNFYLGARKGPTDGLAEGLIEDGFDHLGVSSGSAPPAGWTLNGGGATLAIDPAAESAFTNNTISGKGLLVTDTSTTGGASAGVEQRFLSPPPGEPLTVCFDFRVDDFGNNTLEPTFRLSDAAGTAGIFLHLWKNGWLANIGPNNAVQNLVAVTPGHWYHAVVLIDALDGVSSTYTLKLTKHIGTPISADGTTTTYSNLPFRVNLNHAGKLTFAHNSNGAGTGRWAIDNVVMAGVVDKPRQGMWPFTQPSISALRASSKKVFAHWFSPYPVDISDRYLGDPGRDYYTRNHLNPVGETSTYAASGGLLRDRPLPRSAMPFGDRIDEDIRVAARLGIDGFALDILNTYNPAQGAINDTWNKIVEMMTRATAVDPGFKIMIMPDMNSLTRYDTQPIDAIRALAAYPSAYRLADGRLVVSPYNAHLRSASWWQAQLAQLASEGIQVAFVPVFAKWQDYATSFAPISHGFGAWGVRLPIWNNSDRYTFPNVVQQHVPVAFAPVAAQDSRPQKGQYTEADNGDTFRSHWSSAIVHNADWVQLITWNDYSENTHLAPSSRTGFALYDQTAFYTAWFKTGAQPAVTRDVLHYSYRRHRAGDVASAPQSPNPFSNTNAPTNPGVNEIEVTAFLKAPGTLQIEIGGNTTSFSAPAGVSAWSIPLAQGRPVFRLKRGAHVVLEGAGRVPINFSPVFQDHLYHGGVIANPLELMQASATSGGPYALWRAERFGPAQLLDDAVSGPHADPDGDGLANLLEYAFDHDPLAADGASPLAPTVNAENRPELTYRWTDSRPDLAFSVEWSEDLLAWTADPERVVERDRVATLGGQLVTCVAVPSLTEFPRQFLRLRVERM